MTSFYVTKLFMYFKLIYTIYYSLKAGVAIFARSEYKLKDSEITKILKFLIPSFISINLSLIWLGDA